jgi:hypothetical protein
VGRRDRLDGVPRYLDQSIECPAHLEIIVNDGISRATLRTESLDSKASYCAGLRAIWDLGPPDWLRRPTRSRDAHNLTAMTPVSPAAGRALPASRPASCMTWARCTVTSRRSQLPRRLLFNILVTAKAKTPASRGVT